MLGTLSPSHGADRHHFIELITEVFNMQLPSICRETRHTSRMTESPFPMVCMLAVLVTIMAGCAAPLYVTNRELQTRKNTIRTMGLLPPMIMMYELQYGDKVMPKDEWSREATESIRQAFINEMAAGNLPLIDIGGDDQELNDMADLYNAVDFSIQRHVYGEWAHLYGEEKMEIFPEKLRSFDYAVGPVSEAMERHQVDAVWLIKGFTLKPTTGAQVEEAVGFILSMLGSYGSGGGGAPISKKSELRAALVDKSGVILFYCGLENSDIEEAGRNPDQIINLMKGEQPNPNAEDAHTNNQDIRNQETARRYIRKLLAEYRKAVAK